LDLGPRIVRAVEQGSSIRAAARRFAVSPSAAIKLMQRVRATGSTAPARLGGHRRPLLMPHVFYFFLALVLKDPMLDGLGQAGRARRSCRRVARDRLPGGDRGVGG
jgi:hypothetical protein